MSAQDVRHPETQRASRCGGDIGVARPSLSPLLWCALAAWAGALAGTEAALQSWTQDSELPRILAWLGVAVLVAVGLRLLRRPSLLLVFAVAATAMSAALVRGAWMPERAAVLEAARPGDWSGTVAADPREGPFGTSVRVRLDAAGSLEALVSVPEGVPAPLYGQRVVLSTRIRAALRHAESSADAFRHGSLLRANPWRIRVTGWASGPLGPIAQWRADTIHLLRLRGSVGAESLVAMLFAAEPVGEGTRALEDARTAGVAWAITASGLHLAALLLLTDRLAAFLGLGRRWRALGAVVVACVVTLACGLKLSLVRAAFAAAATVIARAIGRRRDGTAALGAVVSVALLTDPGAAYDVGLALGAIAVSGIGIFGGLARAWARPLLGRTLSRYVGASLAAQVAVAPLSAALFGGVALLGPLVLVLTAPIVEASVMIGFAGALAARAAPVAGGVLLGLASVVAGFAARLWGLAARMPGAFFATPEVPSWVGWTWALAALAIWVRWPQPRRASRARAVAVGLLALTLVLAGVRSTAMTGLVVLNVGQGDAILIRDGGHAVLVDTGPEPVALRRALARAGVRGLDGLVLTHAHDDHTGGIEGLAGIARPDWIAVPDVEDDAVERLATDCAERADTIVRLRRDMSFRVGRITARVLWPQGGERLLDANDTSVILLLERDGRYALLLGDAEDRAQIGALEAWPRAVDTVKVAHHGSPNGNVPDALAQWRPRVALISVGEGNSFGHPSQVVLQTLAALGAIVSRTDLEGDLVCDITSGRVHALRVGASRPAGRGRAVPQLCDNRRATRTTRPRSLRKEQAYRWPLPISPTSSRSTSSTARSSCCWSAPRSACGIASLPWPISTSTWRPSTGIPPPQRTSSTPRTRCPS